MKRLLLVLLLSVSAFAQGAFTPAQTALKTVNGFTSPLSAATITVCAANASGIPCAPVTVQIFKDAALTQPLSNPFTADANGNYQFAVSLGTYTVTVTGFGFSGYSYQVSVTAASFQPPGSGGVVPGVIDPVRKVVLYADGTAGVTTAFHGQAAVVLAQAGGDGMTATQPQGRLYQSAASASTNIVAGFEQGWGANNGQSAYTYGTVARQVLSIRIANTTNVRYWIGETDGKVADMGGADATFATDTPNLSYCMFRFSAGTDTTWKAVCGTSNVAQTVVDTGVAPSTTTATLFEIQNPNYGSLSSMVFSINGVTVATVSSTLPSAASQFGQMWSADNKNTATAVGGGFFWGELFFYK